ncbi:MAG: hypothetical protein HUU46_08220 [Candidatus Hydrogenedentes bacterium]|nr:hypothetical protein [Candidatus Hydrogenedentota bacterium]
MIHLAMIALLGIFAAAQQPQVQQEELPKPGQTQPAQPSTPEQKPATPAPQQTAPAEQPQTQPAPEPAPAPRAAAGTTQHVPAPEERERGQQGKPVAAFWTVIPGK